MPTIRELVAQVEAMQATAFTVIGGQTIDMTVNGGPQKGPRLEEEQLSALVETDLSQDQQTDLMVGRPVGFTLDLGSAIWRVLVQPMPAGLALRGTREEVLVAAVADPSASDDFTLGVPQDDDEDEGLSIGIELGHHDIPLDMNNPPTPPPGALDAFDRPGVPVELPNLATPPPGVDAFDSEGFEPPPTGSQPLAQDDGFGMIDAPEMPEEQRSSTLLEVPHHNPGNESTLLQMAGAVGAPAAQPATDGSEVQQDGTLLMQHAPRVHPDEPAAEPVPAPVPASSSMELEVEDMLLVDGHADDPIDSVPTKKNSRVETGSFKKSGRTTGTLMAMRPPGMSNEVATSRSPSRSLPRMKTGQFPRSEELEPGALCFCRELKEAFEAGGRMGMGVEVIAESDVQGGRGPTVESLGIEPGATFIVNLDDPSRLLGWVLLRREEGFRVFVVTRATGPAGARRILLGIDASARAEAWLDEHPVVALVSGEYEPV